MTTTYLSRPLSPEDLARMSASLVQQPVRWSFFVCCDFCGSASPVHVYAASRMSTGRTVQCWRWAACKDCSDLISRNDWRAIQQNVAKVIRLQFPQIPLKTALASSILAFQEFLNYAVPDTSE